MAPSASVPPLFSRCRLYVALVDPLVSQKLNHYAFEAVDVDLFQLPSALRLGNFEALQNFEAYLYAVTKQKKNDPLYLPEEFLPLSKVMEKYPELVQKRYLLEVAEADKKMLMAKIGLREMWEWELEDKNWEQIIKEFPSLAVKQTETRDERFESLEQLDAATRAKVDAYAKETMLKSRQDLIDQALDNAAPQKVTIGVRFEGGKLPFSGLEDKEKREQFIGFLDQAPSDSTPASDSPLHRFSADEENYYRITVLERDNEPEILTFAEALKVGAMEAITKRLLEKSYLSAREKNGNSIGRVLLESGSPFPKCVKRLPRIIFRRSYHR